MFFTTDTCSASARWLALATTAASPDSGTPSSMHAIAWSGLRHDRTNTGSSGTPIEATTAPLGSTMTAEPMCRDSTKSERETTASSSALSAVKVCMRSTLSAGQREVTSEFVWRRPLNFRV